MKLDLIQSIFVVSSEQLVSAKYLLIDLFFFFFGKIGGSYSAGQWVVSLPRAQRRANSISEDKTGRSCSSKQQDDERSRAEGWQNKNTRTKVHNLSAQMFANVSCRFPRWLNGQAYLSSPLPHHSFLAQPQLFLHITLWCARVKELAISIPKDILTSIQNRSKAIVSVHKF